MRPIDADALDVEQINAYYAGSCRTEDVQEWLDDQPILDVEPVRHGRWEQVEGFTACSECGASPADWEAKPNNPLGVPPFCHSCGAKMDAQERRNASE